MIEGKRGRRMADIELREIREGDGEFLFRLMNEEAVRKALGEPPTLRSDWDQAVEAWREDADEEGYLVWYRGERVGWFAVNGLLAGENGVFLKMAVLLPEYQNRGIGSAVLRDLLNRLRDRGVGTVQLFTDRDNGRARRCYEECGFRVVETLVDRLSDGREVPRVRMECVLGW